MVHLLENVIVLNRNFSHNADTRSSTSSVYLIKPCDFFKFYISSFFRVQNIKYSSLELFYAVYFNITSTSPHFVLLHMALAWYKLNDRKEKQRQAARTPNVFLVIASHYQSLQIVVLLLQACLLGSLRER